MGLFGGISLHDDGNGILCYKFRLGNDDMMLECNKNENTMRLLKRKRWHKKRNSKKQYKGINKNKIGEDVIKMLDEDGSRWEGDWYKKKPFGFGSYYDGEGNKIYSGFMFEGKKIGFGTEYFAEIHKDVFCGNFMNDLRYGWGTTFDRNGQKLYEGDWRFGKNCDYANERIVIEDNCEEDDWRIHDLIKELEIGENCFNEWNDDLVIKNVPNLQSIIVKVNSLNNLKSLKICNCEKLKTIEIEDGIWGDGVFCYVKNVIIESI